MAAPTTCQVCGLPPGTRHRPCAICQQRHDTNRLCPYCRAQNAILGIEWSEDDDAVTVDDVGERPVASTIGEMAGRRRARPAVIRERVIRLLAAREERERVRRVDGRGRWRGYYERIVMLSRREIARRVGCSHTYVNRVFRESVHGVTSSEAAKGARVGRVG